MKTAFVLLLAIVFTVGLTFATVELPYYVDELLQNAITTPGGDSHADSVARLKTDLFMSHYHVQAIGALSDEDFEVRVYAEEALKRLTTG